MEALKLSFGEVVRLWGAVDYEPDIRFFNNVYDIVYKLKSDFPHWWTDRITTVISNDENRESLTLSSKRISFEAANPNDMSSSINKVPGYIQKCLTDLRCRNLKRIGLKLVSFINLNLKFEEIREQLRPLCLPKNEKLEQITSSEILDIALNFDYKWNNKKVMLRIGPMTKEEGIKNINSLGDISRLFPSPKKSDSIADFFNKIPESFLYFDIDVFMDENIGKDYYPQFVQEVEPHINSVFSVIKSLIMECR